MSEEVKQVKRMRGKGKKETFTTTLPDGSVIDLTGYDWGNYKLTKREKLFVFWFTYPNGNCYHRGSKAARKAGYSSKTASSIAHQIRKKPHVKETIDLFDNLYVKTPVLDAYHRIVQRKIIRAEFDISDFYRFTIVQDKDGNEYTRAELKPFDALTAEQRACIDGIEYQGQRSIPVYKLPNRNREEESIIELHNEINNDKAGGSFDVETTAEIIKGNLAVKTKILNNNSKLAQRAKNYKKTKDDIPVED